MTVFDLDMIKKVYEKYPERIAAARNAGAGTRNAGYDYNPETDEGDVSSSYVAPAGNTVIIGRGYAPRLDEDEYDYEEADYNGPKEEDEESTTYLLERPARKKETRWPTPLGEQDMYMLKTQIVPPVCPACPSLTCNSNTLGQSKYKESKYKESKDKDSKDKDSKYKGKDKYKDKYKDKRDSRKQKKYNSEDEDEDDENVQSKNMSMSLPQPLLANFSSFGR
jgi:hypothetical protein